MLLNGGSLDGVRILGRKAIGMMMSDQTGDLYVVYATPGHAFGMGLSVCVDQEKSALFASRGTASWGGEYGTYFFIDPAEEMVGVYSTQVWGTGAGYMLGGFLGAEFQRLAYQALAD
jgi:CubicO group peptidase (beta-lactamase class C family)